MQAKWSGMTADYDIKHSPEDPTQIFPEQLRRYDVLSYPKYEVPLEFVPNLSTTLPNQEPKGRFS